VNGILVMRDGIPDASFYGSDGSMRLNLKSSGRALLMLFLFSDVDDRRCPYRILVGSHLDIPTLLQLLATMARPLSNLLTKFTKTTLDRKVVMQRDRQAQSFFVIPSSFTLPSHTVEKYPRFLAQPPLIPSSDDSIKVEREDGDYSPVEVAVRLGLGSHNGNQVISNRCFVRSKL
jgi:hypothetical protein